MDVLALVAAAQQGTEISSKLPDWPIWVWGLAAVSLLFIGYIISNILKYFIWIAVASVAFVVVAPYVMGQKGEDLQHRVLSAINLAELKECAKAVNETGGKETATKLSACGDGAKLIKKGVDQHTTVTP
jgi:hypothetical protein